MKILTLHVDYIKFKPLKKALKSIADLSEKDKKEQEVKEALVVLTAVEKTDADVKKAVESYVHEIKDIASQVKAKTIVLYPYAHLSSNLSSPETAMAVLDSAEKALKDFKVVRAPFGYYKEFELKVKGHPLSELSRDIKLEPGKINVEEVYDYKRLLNEISKTKLDTSKIKENDHRIIGKQMDLFSFSETAPGMVFWHNNGWIIYKQLVEFWRELHKKYGYQEISTPQILDKRLWQISGHWEKYRDNIFLTDYEKRQFAIKPMNCPGGMLIYRNSPKSYRDFPLRTAELGTVHRQELSGVLAGLFRVIKFTQDDAHIFCLNEKMLENEIIGVLELVDEIYSKFGFKYKMELSTRPEKRIGSDEMWDRAENVLEIVLKKKKIKYKVNKGDGAFYGPKIDFHLEDSLGRTWQCGTIQVDFAMPERFDLEYTDKDNSRKRPIMIHRAIYGSLERFIGVLIEHYSGWFPIWLAPVQVRVLNFTDRNDKGAQKVFDKLKEIPGIRIDNDFSQTSIPSKVKEASLMRIPYIIVIGDKEEKEKTLAVRVRGDSKIQSFKLEEFVKKLEKEICNRE
ncbi:MAG TPA: threonine--tRNA ligase [Candidatus Nanoarchaeia archaeon]|nr:threonine--tRNA ligase [Candidatus Nanoarchaeia archaeon]